MQIRKEREADISEIVSLTQMSWEGATIAELLEKKYGIIEGKKWYEYKGKEIENFCKNNLNKVLVAEEQFIQIFAEEGLVQRFTKVYWKSLKRQI